MRFDDNVIRRWSHTGPIVRLYSDIMIEEFTKARYNDTRRIFTTKTRKVTRYRFILGRPISNFVTDNNSVS